MSNGVRHIEVFDLSAYEDPTQRLLPRVRRTPQLDHEAPLRRGFVVPGERGARRGGVAATA
jgi:hypothetical protein